MAKRHTAASALNRSQDITITYRRDRSGNYRNYAVSLIKRGDLTNSEFIVFCPLHNSGGWDARAPQDYFYQGSIFDDATEEAFPCDVLFDFCCVFRDDPTVNYVTWHCACSSYDNGRIMIGGTASPLKLSHLSKPARSSPEYVISAATRVDHSVSPSQAQS